MLVKQYRTFARTWAVSPHTRNRLSGWLDSAKSAVAGTGAGVLPYQSGGVVPPEPHGAHEREREREREKSRNLGSPRENY